MRNLWLKVLLAAGAAAVAAAAAVWVARRRSASHDLEFVRAPGGATHTGAALATATRPKPVTGPSVLDVEHPIFPPSTFRRFALTPEEVSRWIGQRDVRLEYDPYTYFKYKPGVDHEFDWEEMARGKWLLHTNSMGLREDDELLPGHPDLRVLVAGDSHTDGVCDNADSFSNVLELSLRGARPGASIEVLNAGQSSTTFYNYLGMLERFLALEPDVLIVAVYGGNDFEEGLTLFHLFHGTERPPGMELYGAQADAAMEIHRPCVGQAFNQVKYFTVHPDQIDVALQMARDVTTEIVVTCSRFGVHPIFVYIPPFDVDATFAEHRETMDRVLETLGLARDDEQLLMRIADSYVAFLRSLRVDTLDLRELYRGRTERLYWMRDHHTDVAAHRLIAEALRPLVEAAVPAGNQRVRQAAGVRPRLDARGRFELMSPGAPDPDGPTIHLREPVRDPVDPPWKLELAGSVATPAFDLTRVREMFSLLETQEPDASSGFRYRANLELAAPALRTDGDGFRVSGPPPAAAPDWRVAFLGDELLVGRAPNESVASALAGIFAARNPARPIACIDAACEGYGLHNSLGAFERVRARGVDHVVLCVNGGNDFDAALRIDRALAGRAEESSSVEAAVAAARAADAVAGPAFLEALARFDAEPAQAREATRIALDLTREIARRCRDAGIEFTLVFLPSPHETEREVLGARLQSWAQALDLSEKHLRMSNRIAANYLSYLRGESLEVIDLTNPFLELEGSEFDARSLRLSALGHARLAAFVALAIEHRPRWFAVDR